jgi:hypothetical protein
LVGADSRARCERSKLQRVFIARGIGIGEHGLDMLANARDRRCLRIALLLLRRTAAPACPVTFPLGIFGDAEEKHLGAPRFS